MKNRIGLRKKKTIPTVAKNEEVLAKPLRPFSDTDAGAAPGDIIENLGPGRPLDLSVRKPLETRLGHDFSRVRVHADQDAADRAEALNARAFTVGDRIVFGQGQYKPGTRPGERLLAHELAHNAQQRRTGQVMVQKAEKDPSKEETAAALPTSLKLSSTPDPIVMRRDGVISAIVYFEQDAWLLLGKNFETVEGLGKELGYRSDVMVNVDGHASQEGASDYNLKLSNRRRNTVIMTMQASSKSIGKITFAGAAYGESTPMRPETGGTAKEREENRRYNRRAEIIIFPEIGRETASAPKKPEKEAAPPVLKLPESIRPETPEERLNRILKEKPPEPIKRRSLEEVLREKLDETLDDGLSKIGVPKEYRGYIKDAARSAVEKGVWEVLDRALDGAGVKGKDKDMIKKIIEGVSKEPLL